jgi:hypothetical protein
MRNIMLAATAIAGFGILAAGSAQAQNSGITSGMAAPASASAAPGTINVFVKGKVESGISVGSDSFSGGIKTGTVRTPKLNAVDIQTFVRLYFGFDGKLNNGLEYGSLVELRQFYDSAYKPGSNSNPVQVRRERVYVGSAQAGRVIMGTTDGPLSTMIVGSFGATPFEVEGGFTGSVGAYSRSNGTRLDYPFAGNSWEYMTNKVAYASPSFAGFDFGVSYEPNYDAGFGTCATSSVITAGGCNIATSPGSVGGVALPGGSNSGNRKNTAEAVARYKGSFGPVALAAEIGTMQGGTVGAISGTSNKPISVYDAGLSATFSGVSILGHYMGGDISSGDGTTQKGARGSQFFEGGAMYTMGNLIVGASMINLLSDAGTGTKHNMLHQVGYNVGGTYTFAPGAAVFVSGLYGTRHQGGVNLTGITGSTATQNNNTIERVLTTGAVFNF